MPSGAKVSHDFCVPNWILFNKKYFRSFVRGFFSCGACVDKTGKIMLEQWKIIEKIGVAKNFMQQVILGLNKHFGIFCSGPYCMALQNNTKKGITQGL